MVVFHDYLMDESHKILVHELHCKRVCWKIHLIALTLGERKDKYWCGKV